MSKLPEPSKMIFKEIISNNEINTLLNMFKENNFEIRIAGGAVRDILMNHKPHDIDFATDATPTEMKEMFLKYNIRLINANGESHGTITPRINDKENFEVTTLRFDKVTDGRRAEVIFTKDWKIDAERRDLTINSMFLDRDGLLYDYFNGIADIESRTVRFVGDAEKRIQEDHLRILRYFRFYGRIAESPNNHLDETLDKIRENGFRLVNISGERIWMEMKKIICGNFAPEIIATMQDCDILVHIGLPKQPALSEFRNRFNTLVKNNSNPSVFLSTLLSNKSELVTAWERMKFSNDELVVAHFILTKKEKFEEIMSGNSFRDALGYFQDEFVMHDGEPPINKLKLCFHEYFKFIDRLDVWQAFNDWDAPKFPVRGDFLRRKWDIKGKKLGVALKYLKLKWKESNYTATNEDLVESETLRTEFLNCHLQE